MKKIKIILLGLILILSLGSPAVFAEDKTATGDNVLRYEGEVYYDGVINNDGLTADLQPKEKIEFSVGDHDSFADGQYELSILSTGNRTAYNIEVNGEAVGTVSRIDTGFDLGTITLDPLQEVYLNLNAGDVISILAPDDGTYGWLDAVNLKYVSEYDPSAPAVVSIPDYVRYTIEAETGAFDSEEQVGMGIVNEDNQYITNLEKVTASYTIPAELKKAKYNMTIRYVSETTEKHLKVTVEDISKQIKWYYTGQWDWSAAKFLEVGTWDLNPGDVISIKGVESDAYIQVDSITLTSTTDIVGEEPGNETGDEPGEEPGDEPGEEPGEEPGDETGEEPGDETGEEPGDETGEEPGDETGEEPGDETGEEPGDETGEEPSDETGEEPDDKAGDKSENEGTDLKDESDNSVENPKTGDTAISGFVSLAGLALAGCAGLVFYRKRMLH
ncbi:LPXTG cell wall anchor domain-containing protein [Lederbergia graminis]|uniref:LPXTG cell wall anchor domain-containing protein n=1 Tax=Lederbergia graminis TaxID=735518 RepID=A0ABW0LEK6_9BACI